MVPIENNHLQHDSQSLRPLLEVALGLATPELIQPADRHWMLSIGRAIPARNIDQWGFECRLGPGANRTDFGLSILARNADFLLNWKPPDDWLGSEAARDTWNRLIGMVMSHPKPGRGESHSVDRIWLEFDRPEQEDSSLAPIVFLEPGGSRVRKKDGNGWDVQAYPAADLCRAIREWTHRLEGGPRLTPEHLNRLQRCLEALPEIATGTCLIGVMTGRDLRGVRFIGTLDTTLLLSFFDQVDVEVPATLPEVMAEFKGVVPKVGVHLDIGAQFGPTIGVELLRLHKNVTALHEALDILLRLGLCTEEKHAALIRWRGKTPVETGGGRPVTLCYWVHHLKLVFPGSGPVEAKAYLSLVTARGGGTRRIFPQLE